MLSAGSFNLRSSGPLQDMQPIEPRFTSWVPLNVEWPEGDDGAANAGTDDAAADAQTETEETSLVVPVKEPETVEVAETAVLVQLDDAAPVIADNGGIVWDIRTNQP